MRWKSIATALALMLALSACSTAQHRARAPTALLVKCPPALPTLRDGTAGDVAQTMVEWAGMYHDCRLMQAGLVDALQ